MFNIMRLAEADTRKKAPAGTGQGKRFEDSPTTQGIGESGPNLSGTMTPMSASTRGAIGWPF